MTAAILMIAMTMPTQPRPRHGMGLLPPTKEEIRELKAKGIPFDVFAKNMKEELPPRVELKQMPRPHPAGQGNSGSCTGWAYGYYAKSYLEAVEHGWMPTNNDRCFSPSFIYSQRMNKKQDEGMGILEPLKILQNQGCATWAMMPFHQAMTDTPPSLEIQEQSFAYQIAGYAYGTLPKSQEIKAVLASGLPVVLGISVDEEFMKLRGDSVYGAYDGSKFLGRHAICAVGFDDQRNAIRLINSWGNEWGDRGYCWVHYDLFDKVDRDSERDAKKFFCIVAVGLIDAPTVHFTAKVEPAGNKDYRWKVSMADQSPTLKMLTSVEYSLPVGFEPELVKKEDASKMYLLDSAELKPSSSDAPLELWLRLNIMGKYKTGPRPVVVPCGNSAGGGGPTGLTPRNRVTVPDVHGIPEAEAILRLIRAGLRPRVNRLPNVMYAKEIAPGRVGSQFPSPDTPVRQGSSVTVFLSSPGS
jgi:hypothetical protein